MHLLLFANIFERHLNADHQYLGISKISFERKQHALHHIEFACQTKSYYSLVMWNKKDYVRIEKFETLDEITHYSNL